MNFSWLAVFIFSMIFAAVAAVHCPAPFKSEGHECTVKRTIRGECPQGSQYKASINKCVYKH
ncbi:uncharacterized protein [Drosophila tropicalis]|uniref:uncharacterized protein n=1 Tax=Drosophila tropicalis TaxID=46794 RepID=UPI0035AB7AF8